MVRRGRSVTSIRGFRLRLMLLSVAALAAIVLGGCVQTRTVAGVSDSCTQPATFNDGFFLNRSVFFRVSTQADPLDPRTTSIWT